jgi:DNA polymerase III alpha subunit (gram-positive type)
MLYITGMTAEILEVGAVRGSESFQRFIKPLGSISTKATSVHGMFMKDGNLMKRGQVMPTTDLQHVLLDFATWLSSTSNNVLIGHNGFNFDFPLLVKYLLSVNVSTNVVGYIDTLYVFKSLLPMHTGSFSQENLLRESAMQFEGHSHCALDDCKILQKLVEFHNVSDVSLLQSSVSSEYMFNHFSYRVCKEKNYRSLQVLVHEHVVSDFMANKIASSGLNFCHLQLAFNRTGEDGIRNLFMENVHGKVRVSKCKKIWSAVANYFSHNS